MVNHLKTAFFALLLTAWIVDQSSAQIVAGYATTVDVNSTPSDETIAFATPPETLAIPITSDSAPFEAFFAGTLGDLNGAGGTTATLTQTIYLRDSMGTFVPINSLTLSSGALNATALIDPADFAKGITGDGPNGSFDEVIFDVDGTLSPGGNLTFQGGIEGASTPEPSISSLLLCGVGALVLLVRCRRSRL